MYAQVIEFASHFGDKKFAVQIALKAREKQKGILSLAAKPLDEAEKLIGEDKPDEAIRKLEEFRLTYGELAMMAPELEARAQRLSAAPTVVAQSREQEIMRKILLGDAAFLREDYLSAYRHYREAATMYPEAQTASRAAEKLARLMEDSAIAAAIKQQRIEAECKPLIARADRLIRMGELDEAREVCQKLIEEHPDTEWSAQAAETLKSLEPGTSESE